MSFSDRLRKKHAALWERMVTHPFVQELGDGTLPEAKFRVYFEQDYLFLKDLVTLLSATVSKAPDYHAARTLSAYLNLILGGEESLFQSAFYQWGLSQEQVKALQHLPTSLAYSHFFKVLAHEGTFEELIAVLLCIEWTYADWAQRTAKAGKRPRNPFYQKWIEIHAGEELADFVAWMRKTLDSGAGQDEAKLDRAFHTALRYEYLFWEMGYRGEKWPD